MISYLDSEKTFLQRDMCSGLPPWEAPVMIAEKRRLWCFLFFHSERHVRVYVSCFCCFLFPGRHVRILKTVASVGTRTASLRGLHHEAGVP